MPPRAPTLEAFRTWSRKANYGDVFVYHTSRGARDEALFEHARKLSDVGIVFLSQRRNASELAYTARRCSPENIIALDKVSAGITVKPSTAYLVEEGAHYTGGRPRKATVEAA